MTRKKLLIGNWKMFKTATSARAFAQQLAGGIAPSVDKESAAAAGDSATALRSIGAGVDLAICPPFTAISALVEQLPEPMKVGAQNVHFADEGALTGEVSAAMLADAGVTYVIVGHSERRTLFGETDESVGKKVAAVVAQGLVPVVCVGENLQERDGGETATVVARQTTAAIAGLTAQEAATGVIAYEPLWAIGSGRTAEPGDAETVIAGIRSVIAQEKGEQAASQVRILYGGSVKPDNIAHFGAQPNIDGALVGGASLDADSFVRMAIKLAGGE